MLKFLKPNGEKIAITIFAYFIFYLLDYLVLSQAEIFYTPESAEEMGYFPSGFWIIRTVMEILTFYIIACCAFWIANYEKFRPSGELTKDSLLKYLKSNKINVMTMVFGYSVFGILSVLTYSPLVEFYSTSAESTLPDPFMFTTIRALFDLAVFYLVGVFTHWLLYPKKN